MSMNVNSTCHVLHIYKLNIQNVSNNINKWREETQLETYTGLKKYGFLIDIITHKCTHIYILNNTFTISILMNIYTNIVIEFINILIDICKLKNKY